ncbi:FAD-dependent oxidoreductase [Candidatus Cloacimonadota bacterium]
MPLSNNVLVIGSGVAGMEACLMLSKAGKKVFLVEKLPIIGGKTIKNEETYPNLDCSTCLVAPIQQNVLQDSNIEVLTLSNVDKIEGSTGNFKVTVNKKARYVDLVNCLGCGMCYPVCPVSLKNEWEENLIDKKAVHVPCAGSLPNVPIIDPQHCLQLNGKEACNKCVEACMFGAINFQDKDEMIELEIGAIIVATGYDLMDVSEIDNLGYGTHPGIYTALEFERLFASNGPTEGALTLRDSEKNPESVAIVHCAGRTKAGYCSSVCCMYSSKHAHFIKHKLPATKVYNIYNDICVPDKTYQKFYEKIKAESSEFIIQMDRDKMKIEGRGDKVNISYENRNSVSDILEVDMVILANALIPASNTDDLSSVLDIEKDQFGFIKSQTFRIGSVATSKPGIYVAGCAEGPKDIQSSVLQSEAAVAQVLSVLEQ